MEVESQQGLGSKFYFEIKLEKFKSPSNISGTNHLSNERIAGLRVLVAEDNPMNQLLIKTILEKEGADYQLVNNGLELLKVLEKNQFDVILMDIQMPVMDGMTATKELRIRGG